MFIKAWMNRKPNHRELYFCLNQFKVKAWVFKSPYTSAKSGLWPFNVWRYDEAIRHSEFVNETKAWGLAFHWLWIADAHIEIQKHPSY